MKTYHHPKISYLDGYRYQRAILCGCKEIIRHEEELNEMNVFPIADHDTGTNLKRTLIPLVEHFPVREPRINIISREMADLAVGAAFGYSGIIFSQILSGFADALTGQHRIYPENLKKVMPSAVKNAYRSIEAPVEGTILTVLREWSEEISRACSQWRDFAQVLEISVKKAYSVLEKTPDRLDILRKNNVVDAGAKALVYFLEGIHVFLKTGKIERPSSASIFSKEKAQDRTPAPYCVECSVKAQDMNRTELIERLRDIGQELIFYGSKHFSKFHINTHAPDEVFSRASLFGKISEKKIFPCSSDPSDKDKKPFCLVTDSTCDLPEDSIENNDIYFVPVKVQIGEKIFTDRLDIIPEEFYGLFDTSPFLPKTSQPSLNEFTRVYRHLLTHYRSIISIHLSKALSGTFQTAVQSAQQVMPERIRLIDGKNLSVGLGLILLDGLDAIKKGKEIEEVVSRLETAAKNTKIFIGLPTLKYLVKGGRLTKTKGFIANILNINPILSIDDQGKLVPVCKARGIKNMEQKIYELAGQRIKKIPGRFAIAVAHTNAPHTGNRIAKRIKSIFREDAVMVLNASPVLGAHAGPGAFGIGLQISEDHSTPGSEESANI